MMERHDRRCPEIRECTNRDCKAPIYFHSCVSCLEGRNKGCNKLAGHKVPFNTKSDRCHLLTCSMPMVTGRFSQPDRWQPSKEATMYYNSSATDKAHYRAIKANTTLGDFT
jgi:hypothetical protein